MSEKYFKTIKIHDQLFVIREKLGDIDPRYFTEYTNLFLALGDHSALLIDTGSGIYSIKKIVDNLIGKKELIVLNTHSHWDHVGGNYEYPRVFIHETEKEIIKDSIDISELKTSPTSLAKKYNRMNFKIPPSKSVSSLKEGDKIDLGGTILEIIHTPGHTSGSIALISSNKELFTGDAAHYGSVYLPSKNNINKFLKSLEKLIRFSIKKDIENIYPSHEQYKTSVNLLSVLKNELSSLEQDWSRGFNNKFLNSWIIDCKLFKFVIEN